jgi:hypothetical protein
MASIFVVGLDIYLDLFVVGKCNVGGNKWLTRLLLVGLEMLKFST